MHEVTAPFLKLTKKNEQIHLNVHPGMNIPDVALGVYTYCELVAEQNRGNLSDAVDIFQSVLSDILKHSLKTKTVLSLNE